MNQNLRTTADAIIQQSIQAVLPDTAVRKTLETLKVQGKIYLVAIGKAAWQMAKTASECLGEQIENGIVITKYEHVKDILPRIECIEAGHPIPDENTVKGTRKAIQLVENLKQEDTVLFLISGGGSALFEQPLVSLEELQDLTGQLLASGADITEINTIRKRLSAVKGGRFAKLCEPAKVIAIVLSDVLGDPLDMIASGPAYPDSKTTGDAMNVVEKYQLRISDTVSQLLQEETPKQLTNVDTYMNGSVSELCNAAKKTCEQHGYETFILTDQLSCQAKEAGQFLASIAKTYQNTEKKLAFIAGGETVVKLTGTGKGGRNQELALAAVPGIAGMKQVAIFSIGSDGTDGPTDAAGGYVDGDTKETLLKKNIDIYQVLANNDAYQALEQCGGLIKTGPTGTNVNDVAVLLIDGEHHENSIDLKY